MAPTLTLNGNATHPPVRPYGGKIEFLVSSQTSTRRHRLIEIKILWEVYTNSLQVKFKRHHQRPNGLPVRVKRDGNQKFNFELLKNYLT